MPWKDIEKRREYDRKRNRSPKRVWLDRNRPNRVERNLVKAQQRRDWYVAHRKEHLVVSMARRKRVREENRILGRAYLRSHGCVDCGETDPDMLNFDHVTGKKKMEVSRLVVYGYPWSTIEKEIAKCVVRCWNHHMKRTRMEERAKKGK